MLHTTNSRWPRVLVGQGSGLSKCTKCGVAFVAKHPAQQTCSKCTARKQGSETQPSPGEAAKRRKRSHPI